MYFQKTYKAGKTVEIHKGFSANVGKKYTRGEGAGETPPAMAHYNDKLSRWALERIINENFTQADVHLVLRWPKKARPTPEKAAAEFERAKRQMRKRMKAGGKQLKYIAATAIGQRGALHHHMVTNLNDLGMMRDIWTHGSVHMTRLYNNNFADLAKYFCGQEKGEEGGRIVIYGNRWSCSKGLRRPQPKRKKVRADSWLEPPRAWPGYYLDPDSIVQGVNPVNGAPYLRYRMIKIDAPRSKAEQKRIEAEVEAMALRLQQRLEEFKANKVRKRREDTG